MTDKGKYSKQIMVDKDAYEYLSTIKSMLPKKGGRDASYSDAIKFHKNLSKDIPDLVLKNYQELNRIFLLYYHGDAAKAHITEELRILSILAMKNDKNHDKVIKGLKRLMEEFL